MIAIVSVVIAEVDTLIQKRPVLVQGRVFAVSHAVIVTPEPSVLLIIIILHPNNFVLRRSNGFSMNAPRLGYKEVAGRRDGTRHDGRRRWPAFKGIVASRMVKYVSPQKEEACSLIYWIKIVQGRNRRLTASLGSRMSGSGRQRDPTQKTINQSWIDPTVAVDEC